MGGFAQLTVLARPLDPMKIRAVTNTGDGGHPRGHHNKPYGGLWTSTYLEEGRYASEWVDFIYTNSLDTWRNGPRAYLLTPGVGARIYHVGNEDEARYLARTYPYFDRCNPRVIAWDGIDWVALSADYDAVHFLTDDAAQEPELFHGWDVESTVWFRPLFRSVQPYNGKLVRT